MARRKTVEPPEGHVSVKEAMKMLGCTCQRRILTEYVKYDILPYPTDGLWFARADVERAIAIFDARRLKARLAQDRPKP